MQPEDVLKVGLRNLIEIPSFLKFREEFSNKKELNNIFQFLELCDAFQNSLIKKHKLTDSVRIKIATVREQLFKLIFKKTTSKIHAIDNSIKIKDDWVKSFRKDLSNCLTGDSIFKEVKPRRYKTLTEMAQLIGVDGQKLEELYRKYESKNHPLVNFQIGSILLNSHNIINGLPFLESVIKVGVIYPNYYWHNSSAIEGIGQAIGLLIELLGNLNLSGIEGFKIKILKFYFLYSSRYIYMTNSNLKSVDFYVHRAKIQKAFYEDFIGIYAEKGAFSGFVNPDIQYISDYYLAHQTCLNHNYITGIIERNLYFEASKMYQHGSNRPNGSGGYKEIEEKNFIECVRTGELRSMRLANKIYNEFKSYEFQFSRNEVASIFKYLKERLEHNPEKFIEKMKNG